MALNWIGPSGGLGNRILALSSVLAISKMLETTISFPWVSNPSCTVAFHDLFDEMPGINIDKSIREKDNLFGKNDWEPIFIFQEFRNKTRHNINSEEFCILFLRAMRSLRFKESLLNEVSSYYTDRTTNKNLAIHIRRTDRLNHHKASLRGLLSADINKVKHSIGIIKNTGVLKTLQFGLLPESISKQIENRNIVPKTTRYLREQNYNSYSIYADSIELTKELHQYFVRMGFSEQYYMPGYCANKAGKISGATTFGIRETSVQDAMIELLGMSKSSGIIQNNSASTFSLSSAIIGRTPILSSEPKHQFWRTIKKILGKYPNEVLV